MKSLMKVMLSATLMVVLALTCVAILFTLKPSHSPSHSNPPGLLGGSVKVILNCSLPSCPEEVPRLKVVTYSTITRDFVANVAKDLFGVVGEVGDGPKAFGVASEGKLVTVYKSGGVSYSTEVTEDNLKDFTYEGTWSEAREIAENFLEKMRTYGLWPKNPLMAIEFREVGWHGSHTVFSLNGTVKEEQNFGPGVSFWLKFDCYKIYGPGADFCVAIGKGGRIFSAQLFWRDVEVDGKTGVITPEEALKRLTPEGILGIVDSIIVNGVELAYEAYAPGAEQEYLEPIYLFDCILNGENHFYLYVPASNSL